MFHPSNGINRLLAQIDVGQMWQKLSHPFWSMSSINKCQMAHRICQMVPAHCPFERNVVLFGRSLFQIPALCKLNPFYEQVIELRFRALSYLADQCDEDVSCYCR